MHANTPFGALCDVRGVIVREVPLYARKRSAAVGLPKRRQKISAPVQLRRAGSDRSTVMVALSPSLPPPPPLTCVTTSAEPRHRIGRQSRGDNAVVRRVNVLHNADGTRLISSDIVDDLQARVSVVVELGTLVHAHAELRMEQRGVTEVDVRAMLERATTFEPSDVEGRFMIRVTRNNRPWIVIVEPDIRRLAPGRRHSL
jgi:Domain of unknown function (DUF4258)